MRYYCVVLLCLLFVTLSHAQSSKRNHTIMIDDYFTQADIFSCQISPDGSHVAYVQGSWQKSTNDRKTDLWVVESGTRKSQKLTFDRANDRLPQWSSDGRFIYFLGNRKRAAETSPPYDGKTQIWRISVDGGTPVAITRIDGGVNQFQIADDGESIYYTTKQKHTFDPWQKLRLKFSQIDYAHGVVNVSQVWQLNLSNWRREKIVDDKRVIHEFAVAPNGKKLAMITTTDGKVVSFEGKSRIDICDVTTGRITPLPDKVFHKDVPSPYGWLASLAWSPDSQKLAFSLAFDAYPSHVVVAEWMKGAPTISLLKRPKNVSIHGYGTSLAWQNNRRLWFLGDEKGRVRLHSVGASARSAGDADLTPEPRDDVVFSSFSFSRDGKHLAAVKQHTNGLPDIYLYETAPGDARFRRQLTNANPQVQNWKLPHISVFRWKGAGGDPVEGILELPPDYKKGQRIPLVLNIHGGPTTASQLKLQFWIYGRTLLPANGYAVLCPNYRGSTGYGDKFLTDLIGKENNIEVEDMLKGVDALIEAGIADSQRLAVMGWSNGGYLTNCIITKTNRFKAAISGASIVDAVMEFGANDEPAYAIVFKKGFPWDAAKRYHAASPTYQLNKIRTPTLIHVGANDERCPPGHSRLLYRTLKQYLNVPTELLVYPGEGHGLMKYNNRRAKMAWDLAWLNRYVKEKK